MPCRIWFFREICLHLTFRKYCAVSDNSCQIRALQRYRWCSRCWESNWNLNIASISARISSRNSSIRQVASYSTSQVLTSMWLIKKSKQQSKKSKRRSILWPKQVRTYSRKSRLRLRREKEEMYYIVTYRLCRIWSQTVTWIMTCWRKNYLFSKSTWAKLKWSSSKKPSSIK